MITHLVGRCHVADSNSQVIRFVISKFKRGMVDFKTMSTSDQRKLVKMIRAIHADNRNLYTKVMGGHF